MNEIVIRDYLMSNIGNEFGVFGLMGNIYAESGLNPHNLQNSCEKRIGLNDEQYTQAVDNGTYKKFATDSAGYGLCQWTTSGRKSSLLNYKKSRGLSIGDINLQLEFLMLELMNNYKSVLKGLKNAKSIREASDLVLTKFEMPKDQSEKVKVKRASYGQNLYNQYKITNSSPVTTHPAPEPTPAPETSVHVQPNYKAGKSYTVVCGSLNVRKSTKIEKNNVIGSLSRGAIVKNRATERDSEGRIWMHIGPDNKGRQRYICADNGTNTYVN